MAKGLDRTGKRFRHSPEYLEWREYVFYRDESKCRVCGKVGCLQAHHIKSFAKYPELRLDIDNGITLCKDCHIELHKKYGKITLSLNESEIESMREQNVHSQTDGSEDLRG